MRTFVAFVALLLTASCGDNQDPEGARKLWDEINTGGGFRSWRRAPKYPGRTPSFTAHADEVEIFVNGTISDALDGKNQPLAGKWPPGSTIVKEGYSQGGKRALVAAMQKRADGTWFWAEYDDSGDARYSGAPKICTDCHGHRSSSTDWVYTVDFPR
jgi:hypothetical protein